MPPLEPTGVLPAGRHRVTEGEVRTAFVDASAFAASTTRGALWSDWTTGVALLRSAVVVHAAWIAGSFVTSALDPADIDVLFIVSAEDFAQRPPEDRQVVESFTAFVRGPLGNPIRAHGLRLDSYTLDWWPRVSHEVRGVSEQTYLVDRGYWDDWWSRNRITPKPGPYQRHDALPTRGYLEVTFDDYS